MLVRLGERDLQPDLSLGLLTCSSASRRPRFIFALAGAKEARQAGQRELPPAAESCRMQPRQNVCWQGKAMGMVSPSEENFAKHTAHSMMRTIGKQKERALAASDGVL